MGYCSRIEYDAVELVHDFLSSDITTSSIRITGVIRGKIHWSSSEYEQPDGKFRRRREQNFLFRLSNGNRVRVYMSYGRILILGKPEVKRKNWRPGFIRLEKKVDSRWKTVKSSYCYAWED